MRALKPDFPQAKLPRATTGGAAALAMQDHEFAEIVALICKEDPRYDRKAYKFVRHGLDHTVKDCASATPAARSARGM